MTAPPLRLGSPRPRLRMVSLTLTLVLIAFTVRLLQVQGVDATGAWHGPHHGPR
ncbi:hypothetical protein [Streptomyces sp. NBC_00557]|uniref:hypothetical protein n=1 Tax=Streptomyces sp. NBC_00557 TaxID=2975776 RepID=UPI002E7FD4B7|nr:hypothetical protein [Streptomyces sp. NBC_00557]WUC39480.1 hypothetical protein OG956_37405 [Streptomyces sp. NBC_00557]